MSSQFFKKSDKENEQAAESELKSKSAIYSENTSDSTKATSFKNSMGVVSENKSEFSNSSPMTQKVQASVKKENAVKRKLGELFDKLESSYQNALKRNLKRSGVVIVAAVVLFLVSLPLYYTLGGEFFPPVDENAFVLNVQREPGVNLFELQNTIFQVEDIIEREVPEARIIVSDYGDKRGVEGADNPGGYQGTVRVELVPRNERSRNQFEISDELLVKLQDVPGADIREVRQNPLNPDGDDGLIINIYGFDVNQKKEIADGIRGSVMQLEQVIGATSSADEGRPELRIVMDRERISRLNMTTSQVANIISNAVRGSVATTFVEQGVEYTVLVQLAAEEKSDSQALEDIQVRTPDGTWVPLRSIARIERYQGPSNILRINQERVTEVLVDIGGSDLKSATDAVVEVLNSYDWPDGYRYDIGGTAEEQSDSFGYLMIAFLIASILAYMIMASQFESLVEPFIIIATVPLAMTGVLVMLFVTSTPISVTAMIGLILLAGIVVNNGIVMIDYIKVLQSRGIGRLDAVIQGATRRLRPILMTAGTTILSMVPLALELGAGSETWSPMARAVIGGLTFSTVLMLFVVPCLYYIINTFVEKLGFDAVHKIDPLSETDSTEVI
ncbi:MAG TPA: hypothetical protein DCE78_11250 [Bacteroidetes bacterium]|nr:hypothetical protein [Bacteroidota bacterium]